jgi:hypothetical protein
MTLASIMDLVPPSDRASVKIYRVKPSNRYNALGTVEYKRKRYIVIRPDGFELCTCLYGRHTGVPCRHFFAVVNHAPETHGFNIAQVHRHWINPLEVDNAVGRSWIYLRAYGNQTPTSGSGSAPAGESTAPSQIVSYWRTQPKDPDDSNGTI